MKNISKLFLLLLASTTSISSQAYTLSPAKVTCQGFVNCGMEHLGSGEGDSSPSLVKKNLSASAKARAPSKSGKVRAYNQVDGYHNITIVNRTKVSQSYEYSYTLDCEEARYSYSRNVTLTPGDTFSTNDHTYGVVQKDRTGSFRITATTKNTGESSSSDKDTGTLTISK